MTGTNVSGAIEAGDVNVAGFNGSTPLMGNGPTGAGSLRVTIASDNTANTNAWKVDGSAVTQPVSLVSVPSHAVTNAGTFAAQAAQSGTWTMQPGNTANATPWLFAGVKTHNNALPGATNLGALVGLANAAAPTYTEGNQVLLSTDLTGALRTSAPGGLAQGSITSGQTGTLIQGAVTTAAPTYTTAQTSPVSLDLHGSTRMTVMTAAGAAATLATDATAGATASTTGPQVMGFGASSAPSAVTTGQATALYLDLNGRVQENISQINGVTPLMGAGKHGHGLVARDPNPATARQHNAPLSDSPPATAQIVDAIGERGLITAWRMRSQPDYGLPSTTAQIALRLADHDSRRPVGSPRRLRLRVARPHEAHLRRADGRAVAETRQEHGSNIEVSSSQPLWSGVPRGSGGARAGRGEGTSVGRPRCRRIRPMTAASSMSATRRTRPPHRGHPSTSNPKVRAISDAQHCPRA
jgi:hypothetical protein